MKHTPDLDFARDRAAYRRWRIGVIAMIGLAFGLQMGAAAYRFQSLESTHAALASQHRTILANTSQPLTSPGATLSAEQLKSAKAAQTMLDSLAVPWEGLLGAIEAASTPRVLVEAIQPRADDGSVNISVSSADFEGVAEFVRRLTQQERLLGVMLVSETLPENGAGPLRAVITANWRNTP